METDEPLEWSLRFRPHHLGVDVRQHAKFGRRVSLKKSVWGMGDGPSFAQGTLDMAQLCAEKEVERACFEEPAAIETGVLVEGGKEEIFFWS